MAKITVEKNRVTYERRDELTVIEAYGKDCLRCRSTRNSKISDENWTLLPASEEPECSVEEHEKYTILRNGRISVKVALVDEKNPWSSGVITFYRDDVQILKTKCEGDHTMRNVHTEGDHYQVKTIFEPNPGEHLRSGAGTGRLFRQKGKYL